MGNSKPILEDGRGTKDDPASSSARDCFNQTHLGTLQRGLGCPIPPVPGCDQPLADGITASDDVLDETRHGQQLLLETLTDSLFDIPTTSIRL